ncbi:hypothetical protein LINGRAHAP2_LOCUS30424 [Linum grandiflorum]
MASVVPSAIPASVGGAGGVGGQRVPIPEATAAQVLWIGIDRPVLRRCVDSGGYFHPELRHAPRVPCHRESDVAAVDG